MRYTKRVLDLLLCLALFAVFFPVACIVALLIKFESDGPIFADTPDRVGQSSTRFKMYKFRSMVKDAHRILREDPRFEELFEEYKKGSYKLIKDPRLTRLGPFIRKFSLDELPQLVNVLEGEMSLVGPRAYYPDEIQDQLKKYPIAKKYMQTVLKVRPGITGYWQVYGRSEVNFDKRIKMDADYVQKISLWYDVKIIFRTPWAMLTGKGAI